MTQSEGRDIPFDDGQGHKPIPHDERIALCNRLMREQIAPRLPGIERAVLMVFPAGEPGVLCYMANARRSDMREVLRGLLAKWDRDAKDKGES